MKDTEGNEISLTCHTGPHENCSGRTYYGSIFGDPTTCECGCHGWDDEFREGDEEAEWKPIGLLTEDGLTG